MNKNEVETGIRVGMRHVRDIQITALEDLIKEIRLKGRLMTYEDCHTIKQLQIAGNIMDEKIKQFYNHQCDETIEDSVMTNDEISIEEDEFI